jgi:uncharacterized protein YndB with AHSA1/START domain
VIQEPIVRDVIYPHPPERVWRALVDPEELAAWLMPNDFVAAVGQRFTVSCEPFGSFDGEVIQLDPPRRLSCQWSGTLGDTIVTFELTAAPGGTRLHLEHRGWTEGDAAARTSFDSGWTEKLTRGLTRVLDQAGTPTS